MDLNKILRTVPDFPIKGVMFKDISSILEDPKAFKYTVDKVVAYCRSIKATQIVAPDARGFIWGAPVALALGIPLHIVRKPGKLPGKVKSYSYTLEYGEETLEMLDSVEFAYTDRICIIDDVSATGGTANAMVELIKQAGGFDINYACVIDLTFLQGTAKLTDYCGIDTFSVLEVNE